MNPAVPPPDPTISKRALDVIQWLATVAGSLAIVWGFLKTIGKPFIEWRQKRQTAIVKEVLKPELELLAGLRDREEETIAENRRLLARQAQVFADVDTLLALALDNRDRLDEMNCLLDELGLASPDRRDAGRNLAEALEGLIERRKQRRRLLGEPL